MVLPNHKPEWPDKILFSGLLLVIGGVLGTLFGILNLTGNTGSVGSFVLFEEISAIWIMAFSVAAIVFGALTVHYQSWLMAFGGIISGILSFGFFGLVPILSVTAAVVLIKAVVEGEELKLDEHKVEAWEWPDKAMAASLFLTALGAIHVIQAIATFAGTYQGLIFETPTPIGFVAMVVAAVCFIAARQTFRQDGGWMPWAAGIAGIITASYIIVGPVLAILALVFLGLADKEGEFLPEAEQA